MSDAERAPDGLPETLGSAASTVLSNRLLRELRQRFEQSGPPQPTVEQVLRAEGIRPDAMNHDVLTDLVYAEWMLRIERGEAPSHDEFRSRFPMISQRLDKQWSLDESLADLSEVANWSETIPPTYVPESGVDATRETTAGRDRIGKYKVICPLGSGGQADVYRALHPELQRDVVIKLVRPLWRMDTSVVIPPVQASQVQQVLAEGRSLAQLSHPNVAQVYDVDQEDGCPFLVMEYVQGKSLDQYHRDRPLDAQRIARLVASVARAAAAAHARGILHRDIKPQNIVVRDDGEPKLIDFGLARITSTWHPNEQQPGVCGTLGFMAPEQARGDVNRIGPASDIFGLGAVLYYLLTGQPPIHGSNSHTGVCISAMLERARRCEWDRTALTAPNVPARLAAICSKAMSADPSARFATAAEFAEALESFAAPRQPRVRRVETIVTCVAIVMGVAWFARPTPKTNDHTASQQSLGQKETRAELGADSNGTTAVQTDLRITVHRDDARVELIDAVPLHDGDQLSIQCRIPSGHSLMLFAINGEGRIQHVVSIPSQTTERKWRYPENPDATVPLTGPVGTECLLVIGSAGSAISIEQVQTAWGDIVGWPQLANSTVLRLTGSKVRTEQIGRDLGSPQTNSPGPTEKITRTLEQFGSRMESQCPVLEAVAFRQKRATE